MKTKSLVIGYVLALALLLFAQHRRGTAGASIGRTVIDLSYSVDSRSAAAENIPSHFLQVGYRRVDGNHRADSVETWMEAPAQVAPELWALDQIPPARLIAPLVVLDMRESVQQKPGFQLSVTDIANWERTHGEIPLGSVVMLLTGSPHAHAGEGSGKSAQAYSADAARFLIEGRETVGLGIDREISSTSAVDSAFSQYALLHSTYLLANVANLDHAPATGGVVVVAPEKLQNRTAGPVRILALAK